MTCPNCSRICPSCGWPRPDDFFIEGDERCEVCREILTLEKEVKNGNGI